MSDLFATPWTVACQAPLSMGFSSQIYWSQLPFPSPGDLPNPGIKPMSPILQVDSLLLSHLGSPVKECWPQMHIISFSLSHWPVLCYTCCAKSFQSCPALCDSMDSSPLSPLSMGFSRQEYWSELPCPSPGDLPNPGIKLTSLMSSALAGRFLTTTTVWEAPMF